jgi:hypothetical protein
MERNIDIEADRIIRSPIRLAAWWARFRLSRGIGALSGNGTIADQSINDQIRGWTAQEVATAETLIDGRSRKTRLWRARKSQPIDRSLMVLADFCSDGSSRLRPHPWVRFAAPYDIAPLSYRRLGNALLFVRSGLVMPAPFVAVQESHLPWTWIRGREPLPGTDRVTSHAPTLRLNSIKPRQIVDGPTLSLCHDYIYSYGHWFTDALPPLLDMLDAVKANRLRVLLPALLPWQRRTLQLLGVPDQAIVETDDTTVACRDLVCHSFGSAEHYRRPGSLLQELFEQLRSVAPHDPGPKLIYASRRAVGSWRQFANEGEIESALTSAGFTVVMPECMTLDEQMAAFARAEVIVGPHGSALANAGFAPPGCLIVDIVPERMPHGWIYGLARQLGHYLVVLPAACENTDGSEYIFSDFKDDQLVSNFRYRVAPGFVTERLFSAMRHLGRAGSA